MPLVYGLLPGKTETLYTNFLSALNDLAPTASLFDPQTVMCDFERGLHNAAINVWPSSTIRSCYFHFKQCLWRKMQAFELVPEYHIIGSPIRKAFRMIGALPFVEPGSVVAFWNSIKPNLPDDMIDLIDYFERTWIGTSSRNPIFDIYLWNQYDTVLAGLPRSNNIVEGWHNGFQSLVGTTNPTLWTFLSAVKKEETLTFAKKVKMAMREDPEPQKKKWREYNERLDAMIEDFDNYEPTDYLHCIGELLNA